MKTFILVIFTLLMTQNSYGENGQATLYVKKIFAARPRSLTMHYSVKLQCEPPGQSFLATPLKNQKFKWRFGDLAKSELVTDNQGMAEFTYTSHDGKINETLEIEIQGKTYRFSSSEGMATLPQFSQCP